MTKLAARLRCYGVAASTAIRDRTAYAGNFSASMLTYGLFVFIFSRVWAGAYESQSTIAGYTRSMVVWYFIIAEITSFGFGRYFWGLARDVKSGQVAYLLARPYDFVGYHYAERVGGSFVDAAIILAEGLLIGLLLAGPLPEAAQAGGLGAGFGRAGLVALSLVLAGSLNFYLQFALALTAFWLEENDALYWIFQKFALIVGTLIPIEFLPEQAARVALWTPFPYLSYAPARIFVDFSWTEAGSLLARQAIWVVLAMLLARFAFALGGRRVALNGG
jgi:ABC-2 type transport system permease protein